jgi:hypothetical protein
MTSLLVGCETVLYMANRLKAYLDFLHGLPETLTRTYFETAVIKLYAHILQFLARAIQIYQTSTIQRVFTAFWKDGDVEDFEKECNQLGMNVEIEASNCDRTLNARDREHTEQFQRKLQGTLEELQKSHKPEALSRIEKKIDLARLPYVKGATFDSHGEDYITCHRDTRVDLLHQLRDWAQQPRSNRIFWLNGKAGTGKSTISRTFAEWLTGPGRLGGVDLGASFFFKRGEGDRDSASLFFPTIAQELLSKVSGLDTLIAEVVTSDPFISNKRLGMQFDKLIYEPLQKLKPLTNGYSTLVVVVDALDECQNEVDIRTILELWSRLPQITTVCLKLFLTSRPDMPILEGMEGMHGDARQDMILHEVPRTMIQHDISVFLKDAISKIRKNYNSKRRSNTLDHDWPGDKACEVLVDMAVPLFVVAATICRFIGDPHFPPQRRLETILQSQSVAHISQIEKTYLPVVEQLSATLSDSSDENKLYQDFQLIVGSIIAFAEPLSVSSLAALLNVSTDTIEPLLGYLHSVLQVPADFETPIRTFHLSFSEFLLSDRSRQKPFGVNGPATHRMLATKCLELLSRPDGLRENLCDLDYPGQLRQDVDRTTIDERLTPAFQYACRYWVYHVQQSKVSIRDDDEVHVFLQRHFLHWLEALSLMNRLAEVIGHISILQLQVWVRDLFREGTNSNNTRIDKQFNSVISLS